MTSKGLGRMQPVTSAQLSMEYRFGRLFGALRQRASSKHRGRGRIFRVGTAAGKHSGRTGPSEISMRSLRVPMMWEEWERLPWRFGWKHEYWDGPAHLTPRQDHVLVEIRLRPSRSQRVGLAFGAF